jgi:hypothetical protein
MLDRVDHRKLDLTQPLANFDYLVVSNNSAEACDRLVAWVLYRRYCRFCW